ncbi:MULTISPECIES: hypothetical protein [Rodentibacter]|uniref:Uncharacterized protein n=2 Tax=Rodentibacter TaxID=1960084 RepID=A0A1V3L5D8_9PAST|nr:MULTISPECIES: hypothetical protein [Rodentibacter]OOF45992.1 hypothetical protein BKK51_04520 [Rodentibacter trehalosifermentans]OOF48623.1 hypothetical protein BKK53_09460 [Rodentibacter trehalosifermentans]OOF82512.1 hypothetical protein BKG93_11265 [Rodentibacter ratti]OOF85169.1 hypothetical protein BKG88_08675 [Rodentibacter ratti]
MYVLETESAAEKFCKEHQVAVPQISSIDDSLHYLNGESRFRVERSFDRLQQGFREFLLTIAEVDLSDLKSRHHTGFKLHHYTEQGQRKIARAFRKVRLLSQAFPESITEREFLQIDRRGE